ncbi:MAG: LacI family DNA-binding transcriptional regulator [Propionibacteriaceae bacterium]|nr:LacI family DNA-binding transcriptional regulator [Propionibacteriaceae bacterium]
MMGAGSRRASLADVARRVGVSSQTVSRVVRGGALVAPETRERVQAAVEELGYRPNLAARSLSGRRTGVIHIINATPLFGGHARTFLSVVQELGSRGYQTSVSAVPDQPNPAFDELVPLGVDGVVVLGGHADSADLVSVLHDQVPAVFVGQRHGLPEDVASVAIDQGLGARLATEHLLGIGRSRLLHLCGPSDWLDAHERRDGFLRSCETAGVNPRKISVRSWSAADGYLAAQALPEDIDGIFASNDHLALGAMRWLAERGRVIPDDVAVVGFDDAEGSANFLPPLTTLRQPHREVGVCAVAHLAALIDGQAAEHTLLSPELIIRRSTKGS